MQYEDYLPSAAYEGKPAHTEKGFVAFQDEKTGLYFFALTDADGKILLKSEGYPQITSRENGIQSVIKNRANKDFYSIRQSNDGKFYLSLRAGNHREIARSASFNTDNEAFLLIPFTTGEKVRTLIRAAAMPTNPEMDKKERANNKEDDDYLAVKEYAGHPNIGQQGYPNLVPFRHANGQYYFAWYDDDGNVLMRSEGYPTAAARDNGMASVAKNRDLEERYGVEPKLNRYFTFLKAGNHQEIARSGAFPTELAAKSLYPSARKAAAETIRLKAEADEAARLKALADAKARVEAEVARIKAEAEARATRLKAAADAKAADEAEAARLKAEADAKIAADAETARLKAVAEAKAIEEMRLKTAADAEAARLKAEADTEATRLKAITDTKVTTVRSFANGARTGADDAPAAMPRDPNDDDDYLTVKEYVGHTDKSGYKGLVPFKHANGKYYFVWYDDDGTVLMRSEGFSTAAARDNDMIMVDKNRDVEDRFSTMEKMNRYFTILRGGNRQEIARSGPKMTEAEAKALYPSARKAASDEKIRANRLKAEQEVAAKAVVAAPIAFLGAQNLTPQNVVSDSTDNNNNAADDDDYLATKEYEAQTDFHPKHGGFIVFQHPRTKYYYFAVLNMNTGKVLLRSEGYPNIETRENDIEAVIRNRDIKERYVHKQLPTGAHYLSLQNGNKQEIGRTPVYQTETALWGDWAVLSPNNKSLGLTMPWALAGAGVSALAGTTLPTTAIKLDVTPKKPEMEDPTTVLVPKGLGIGGLHQVEINDQPKPEAPKVVIERDAPMLGAVGLIGGISSHLPSVPKPEIMARGLGLDSNMEVPKVEIPKVEVPNVEIPKVEMPKVEVPKVSVPKVEIPKIISPEPSKIFAKAESSAFADAEVAPASVETKPVASESRNRNWWLPIMAMALLGMGAIFYKIMENRKTGDSTTKLDVTSALPDVPLKPVESVASATTTPNSSATPTTPSNTTSNSMADAGTGQKPSEYDTKVIPKGAATTVATPNGGSGTLESKGANVVAAKPADKTTGSGTSAKGASAAVVPKAVTGTLVAKGKAAGIAPGKLNWLLFDFDKSDLRSQSMSELDKLAAILKNNASAKAELDGHTDFKGGEDYNIRLSEHRAENAKKYLISKGIPEDRIILKTHGKNNPYTDNKTDEGRQLNRRVEIRAIDASGNAIETSVAPRSGANQK